MSKYADDTQIFVARLATTSSQAKPKYMMMLEEAKMRIETQTTLLKLVYYTRKYYIEVY